MCRSDPLRCRAYFRLFFFSSRRRHTRCSRDWSSDVCSSDLFVSDLPPVGPSSEPITCSKRQSIAPPFGQLASVPAVMKSFFCAHTRLLSKELCHGTSPKRGGFWPRSFWISNRAWE